MSKLYRVTITKCDYEKIVHEKISKYAAKKLKNNCQRNHPQWKITVEVM